jgi:hypothetical protein
MTRHSTLPILFSAPMIVALLAGCKTQTRRVIKGAPEGDVWFCDRVGGGFRWVAEGGAPSMPCRLPHAVGDSLWVREAWRTADVLDDLAPRELLEGCALSDYTPIRYEADGATRDFDEDCDPEFGRLRPGMFMPRWAPRITLTVIDVRVQRLQEISEADAKAEGVEPPNSEREGHDWSICPQCGGTRLYNGLGANLGVMPDCDCYECDTHRKRFHHLWNHLHGPGAWDANPWVAAYSFSIDDGAEALLKER